MISRQFHPADEVTLIGDTQHGLAAPGAEWLRIGGALFPYLPPREAEGWLNPNMQGDTHLLRVPGVAPVPLTAEQLAAEAAQGRVWQDYTLIAGQGLCAHGSVLDGAVYVDPTGVPWLVRGVRELGEVSHGEPWRRTITLTPYGRIGDAPVAGRSIALRLTADELGLPVQMPVQLTGPYGIKLRLQSISSDGSQIIYALRPGFGFARYGPPVAFWQLTLSGAGDDITAQMSVLRTLEQTVGERTETQSGTLTEYPTLELEATHEVEGPPEPMPPGSTLAQWARLTVTGITCAQTPRLRSTGVTGQLLAVLHDDADTLVEISMDVVNEDLLWIDSLSFRVVTPHRARFVYPDGMLLSEERGQTENSLRMGHENRAALRLYRDGALMDEVVVLSSIESSYQNTGTLLSLRQFFLPGARPSASWGGACSVGGGPGSTSHDTWSQIITNQTSQTDEREAPAWAMGGIETITGATYRFEIDSGWGGIPMRWHENIERGVRGGFSTPSGKFTAAVESLTNNLYGIVINVRYDVLPPSPPLIRHVPITLVAPRATLELPATDDDNWPARVFASYHPLTHEIYAGYVGREQWQVAPGVAVTINGVNWI